MALPSPSSDSPPAGSPSPTSQGGSRDGAKADVARKTKGVEHLLAKLEKKGVEIDGKIASIVDDGMAKIKAEAAREIINDPKRLGKIVWFTIGTVAFGFLMGTDWYERSFYEAVAKIFLFE